MNVPSRSGERSSRGFTFIELLWAITIMLILTAILLPAAFGLANNTTLNIRDRQNARKLSVVSLGAQAAGLDLVVPGDLTETIDNLVKGGTPSSGVFAGHYFAVPELTENEKITAALFLRISDDGVLICEDRR